MDCETERGTRRLRRALAGTVAAAVLMVGCATMPAEPPAGGEEDAAAEEQPRCGLGCKLAIGVLVFAAGGYLLADDFADDLADALTGG